MTFREKLCPLLALQPVLDEPGVLVVGSEVPNLLQPAAASTPVVSQGVLTDARAAYAISEEDAHLLLVDGYVSEACGSEVTPAKLILFVDESRLATLPLRRPIPIDLGLDFLAATAVVLVPFDQRRLSPVEPLT